MMLGMACDPLQHTSMYQRAEEDSDDSDGEGGLGNVSRVIIRPPGHSGKAKRGHLCFDAAFETGNLGRADLVGEFEYDLFLRPDTSNPRYRFWFNFTVDNVKQDQRVIFNIVNISKARNLFREGMTPLVKSSGRPKWQRLPRQHVFYYRSPVHQNHYVLSFAFAFEKEDEVYQFAVAPPYSFSRLQSYLGVLETRFAGTFVRSELAKSLQGRKLELLTVDHVQRTNKHTSNDPDKNDEDNTTKPAPAPPVTSTAPSPRQRVIVILVRAHAGESPASYVCQGFLEFLLGAHPMATILRQHFIFKIVPMLNPDGVFLGNNRCNLVGQDMNRCWNVSTEFSSPTVLAVKGMLRELDNSDSYQVDFCIDFHAHTTQNGAFIYGNTYEDVYRYERHLVFPKLLATNAEDFVPDHMMFNADERKTGSSRRFCCERLSDTINAYTLEVSMGGYYVKGTGALAQYTEEGYMRFGRNVARTLFEYYRFTNVLIVPPYVQLSTRRSRRGADGRPRTHHGRSRSQRYISPDLRPRPRTTRAHAPISYTDLCMRIDGYETAASGDELSSPDGSPQRPPVLPPRHAGFGARTHGNIFLAQLQQQQHHQQQQQSDQFSLMTIQASRFSQLDFVTQQTISSGQDVKLPRIRCAPSGGCAGDGGAVSSFGGGLAEKPVMLLSVPKPSLSIIDFNQITRGGLERATKQRKGRGASRHLQQQ